MKTALEVEPLVSSGTSHDAPAEAPRPRTAWTVHIQLALPSDMTCRVLPSAYNEVDELLEGRGPGFRVTGDTVELWFGVEARHATEALAEANRMVPGVIELLDPGRETSVTVSISERSDDDTYAGMGEVAAIMGVSKQRIYQLAQRKDFPSPAFRLKATPVWRTADIYKFRRSR